MLLFEADSPDVAEAFAQADPYVRAGLVKHWRVRAWTTVVGERGGDATALTLQPHYGNGRRNRDETATTHDTSIVAQSAACEAKHM